MNMRYAYSARQGKLSQAVAIRTHVQRWKYFEILLRIAIVMQENKSSIISESRCCLMFIYNKLIAVLYM